MTVELQTIAEIRDLVVTEAIALTPGMQADLTPLIDMTNRQQKL